MIAQFLLVLREGLEAALIVGIVFAYLRRTGRVNLTRFLTLGVLSALVVSVVTAAAILIAVGQLSDVHMEIFEGVASLVAVVVLTFMVFWMAKKGPEMKAEIEGKLEGNSRNEALAVFGIAFVAVVREGLESVLFLSPLALSDGAATVLGIAAGAVVVLLLAVLLVKGVQRLNIRRFFAVTGVLLIIFAAGLTATAVHEFNEAGVVPAVTEVWNINPPQNADGSYPLMHDKGAVGGTLKALVGYNGNPSLTEVIAYVGYWLGVVGHLALTRREQASALLRAIADRLRGLGRTASRQDG